MKIRLKKRSVLGIKRIKLDGKIEKVVKKGGAGSKAKEGTVVFISGMEGIAAVGFSSK